MREAMFIKKNADKWKGYQQKEPSGPDEAAEQFITLMDDLAYAKTFYPKSKSTKWINGLAASVYQNIYRNKKEKYSRIFSFWKYELPLVIRRHHRTFLFTTIIFILFVCIGFFSSMVDPDFVRGVMGDDYVQRTEENIAKGDPFGIYKDKTPFNMFVYIAMNNIRVTFLSFIGGFTLGIVTLFLLWENGIMLGSFQYMFFSHGLGIESVLVIWIHGTLEISSIIIGGVTGFILANGLLFPGTYTRIESFKRNIKDAAKILICIIPFLIAASFLENYITQLMSGTFDSTHHGMPVWGSVLILAGSLTLVVWYFVIWPIILDRKGYFIKKGGIISRLQTGHA